MRNEFLRTLTTSAVTRAQEQAYGRARPLAPSGEIQPLGVEERSFIAERDSFYLSSVSENGWPYIQHRGGPKGFLRALSDRQLAFADYTGNRQLLTTGNVSADDRVALFLMDYRARERLKIIGHARVLSLAEAGEIAPGLGAPDGVKIERVFVIEVVGFDWNCSKYITPRFTLDEIGEAVKPLRARIAELETQLASR